MELDVKYLRLGFQNGTHVDVDMKWVKQMTIVNVADNYDFCDGWTKTKKNKFCSHFFTIIGLGAESETITKGEPSVFEPVIKHHHVIDHIELLGEDRSVIDSILVPWSPSSDDDNDDENYSQDARLLPGVGDLRINISVGF